MNPVKQKMEEKWRLSYRIVEMYGQWRRKRAAGAGTRPLVYISDSKIRSLRIDRVPAGRYFR